MPPLLAALSALTGVPEPSLRLLLTILCGFPTALLYRALLDAPNDPKKNKGRAWLPHARKAYLLISGLALSYFYNGRDIVHSLICVTVTYLVCALVGDVFGARGLAAAITWVFNLAYLLAGYHFTTTDGYAIDWTMPQCVLCLRLLGFAMDYYDGQHVKDTPHAHKAGDPDRANPVELNRRTKYPITFDIDTPLRRLPPFHEFLGYCYFFGAFLVGPQFSFSLYRKFVHGHHLPPGSRFPSGRSRYALNRVALGIVYMAITQVGAMYFSTEYLSTKDYAGKPYFRKLAIMWITGKLALNKYLGVWILNEAPCVLSGISFSGLDRNGNGFWDGCCNIDCIAYEKASSLNHIVASFNMNTNNWAKNYVFKRLRFLNNKHLSAVGTLLFLAIWHGTHAGYFCAFFLEFVDMEAERRLKALTRPAIDGFIMRIRNPALARTLTLLRDAVCWVLTSCALYYSAAQFDALRWRAIVPMLAAVGWIGHLAVAAIFAASFAVQAFRPPPKAGKARSKQPVDEKIESHQLKEM